MVDRNTIPKFRGLVQKSESLIPKFSSIDLAFTKDYLYVDYDEDDMLIQLLIESAKENIMFEAGVQESAELDKSRVASVLLIQMVSDLYNTRSTLATDTKINQSPLYSQMIKSIRGSYRGYKL